MPPTTGRRRWGRQGGDGRPTAISPPSTSETAWATVKVPADAQDSRDLVRVALAPTEDAEWRNGDGFLRGWEAIEAALRREWLKERHDWLRKNLRRRTGDRISLRFEDEWHDARGRWRRNQGNGYRQVDADGPMRRRDASFDDVRIVEAEHGYR